MYLKEECRHEDQSELQYRNDCRPGETNYIVNANTPGREDVCIDHINLRVVILRV